MVFFFHPWHFFRKWQLHLFFLFTPLVSPNGVNTCLSSHTFACNSILEDSSANFSSPFHFSSFMTSCTISSENVISAFYEPNNEKHTVTIVHLKTHGFELTPFFVKYFCFTHQFQAFHPAGNISLFNQSRREETSSQLSTISLILVLSKTFEFILSQMIWKYLKSPNLFFKERSTSEILFLLSDC